MRVIRFDTAVNIEISFVSDGGERELSVKFPI